jgi:hypothetical protein
MQVAATMTVWKEHLLYPHQRTVRSREIEEAVGDPP